MERVNGIGLAIGFALALIGGTPRCAVSQIATPAAGGPDTIVNLDIDGADITSALQQLFKQANVSYFIQPDVKSRPFSAAMHAIPFRTALDALLADCGEPLDSREDHGVWRVFHTGPAEQEPAGETKEKFGNIRMYNTTAESILPLLVTAFKNDPAAGLKFTTVNNQNILSILYPDTEEGEASFREAQTRVRLYDIRPKVIECQVQVDCMGLGAPAGKQVSKPILSLTSRTNDKSTAHFKITSAGADTKTGNAAVDICNLGLDVKPGINGDGTLSIGAAGTLNLCVRLPGESSVRRLQTTIDYAGQLNGGNTILTTAPDLTRPVVSAPLAQNVGNTIIVSTLRLGGVNAGAQSVQIRVIVTANILPPIIPQQVAGN